MTPFSDNLDDFQKYAMTLSKQLGLRGPVGTDGKLGNTFSEAELNQFSDEQLAQLYELYNEASKPREDQSS